MRAITALVLLLHCVAALAASTDRDRTGPAAEQKNTTIPPSEIVLFDLHDPDLMDTWSLFLATTPMLNGVLLPTSLQDRLANVVETYRFLTPDNRPAFFVATYFDLLSERLLGIANDADSEILPTQVCPVFVSGADASVSKLLAMASGLPEELFVHAAGRAERYRYLFLQTEFSHCRFMATTLAAAYEPHQSVQAAGPAAIEVANLSFDVGASSYTATLSTKKELRALLETIGDAEAIAAFRRELADRSTVDEAEVLTFIRLLSLLATDGKSGYAAIPLMLPLVSDSKDEEYATATESLRIADVLDLAYRARELFRRVVPFAIIDTEGLLKAKLAVTHALADGRSNERTDNRLTAVLERFVAGSDLLLAMRSADEKMPLPSDSGILDF